MAYCNLRVSERVFFSDIGCYVIWDRVHRATRLCPLLSVITWKATMATDTIKTSFTFTNNAMSTRERLRDPPRSTISDHMGKTRRHAKSARIPRSLRLGQSLINFKPFCGSFYVMFLVIPARTRGARHPVPGGWNNIHFASKSFNYNSTPSHPQTHVSFQAFSSIC